MLQTPVVRFAFIRSAGYRQTSAFVYRFSHVSPRRCGGIYAYACTCGTGLVIGQIDFCGRIQTRATSALGFARRGAAFYARDFCARNLLQRQRDGVKNIFNTVTRQRRLLLSPHF
jgi:hypothetical protein